MKHLKLSQLILSLFMAGALIFLGLGIYQKWRQAQILIKEKKFLEAQLKSLKEEGESLIQESQNFVNEEALEKEARLSLGLKKPGEKVILIIPTPTTTTVEATSTPLLTKWLKWWQNLFRGKH